jgi:hypothetical protein
VVPDLILLEHRRISREKVESGGKIIRLINPHITTRSKETYT